ncbi:MAG: zinc ribbon domain-containing protein, partial [Methanobrevibacter woesei]|nr:zinc ribbon domain-containing protein [Methanobrevibacter woesei]
MFCPKCGKKIPDDAKFCKFCGNEIKKNKGHGRSRIVKKDNDKK